MSMLAEPKKKVKWGMNPRGNLWADDSSKFGQKLLEKMGWQKGKGLGKNENGAVNCISVVSKDDNKGVGWDDKLHNWVAHQDEFNALLQQLNKEHNANSNSGNSDTTCESPKRESASLEVRSKTFKSHIHYGKFVRGKDVSQYSAEDMECIFGKKLTNDVKSSSENIFLDKNVQDVSLKAGKEDKNPDEDGILTFTSSSNVLDYFAQKMKLKKIALTSKDGNGASPKTSTKNKFTSECNDEKLTDKEEKPVKRKKIDDSDCVKIKLEDDFSGVKRDDQSSVNISNENYNGVSFSYNEQQRVKHKKNKKRKEIVAERNDSIKDFEANENNASSPSLLDNSIACYNSFALLEKSDLGNSAMSEEFLGRSADTKSVGKQNDKHIEAVTFGESVMQVSECEKYDSSELSNAGKTSLGSKNSVQKSAKERLSDMLLLSKYTLASKKPPSGNVFQSNMENWVATLKIARKQSRYKLLVQKLQQDPVLSTTNLSSIEGYGTTLDV